MTNAPDAGFLRTAGRILNAGQSHSLLITGNIHDLFFLESRDAYVPLTELLPALWTIDSTILVVYEINGPIRFMREEDRALVRDAWLKWRTGLDSGELAIERMLSGKKAALQSAVAESFDTHLQSAIGNPTVALELLRQMCLCSRTLIGGKPLIEKSFIIILEAADMMIPDGPIISLSDVDRHRMNICHDWFSDPGFVNGRDAVVLLTESRSLLNQRVARLPQVLEVQAPSPNVETRQHFIEWFIKTRPEGAKIKMWASTKELAEASAGLTLQAIAQLLKGAAHEARDLTQTDVIAKVEEFIQSQLGEDIIEFKKPSQRLDDVIGFSQLKTFLRDEFMPRISSGDQDALAGAAVCGPIGVGKTFIFEAVAAELDMVVLVLKSIRSQWFGQTDVIFERLRRVLEALSKVLIFVDEADTQFGGVGPEAHETERRLTGKVQAMMSDPRLRGRVVWLLMTARIHMLSPDIRRPGRVGDLIIPLLDPEGDDRKAFLAWMAEPGLKRPPSAEELAQLETATRDFAASSFAALRSELKSRERRKKAALTMDELLAVVNDHMTPAIGDTRRYQALQALVNCTRKSLLPDPKVTPDQRRAWLEEIEALERRGIH